MRSLIADTGAYLRKIMASETYDQFGSDDLARYILISRVDAAMNASPDIHSIESKASLAARRGRSLNSSPRIMMCDQSATATLYGLTQCSCPEARITMVLSLSVSFA